MMISSRLNVLLLPAVGLCGDGECSQEITFSKYIANIIGDSRSDAKG